MAEILVCELFYFPWSRFFHFVDYSYIFSNFDYIFRKYKFWHLVPCILQTKITKRHLFNQASIEAEEVILKIDIEGYECKALPEDVIMGSSGKQIPFIFLEWGQLVSWTSIQLFAKQKDRVKTILLNSDWYLIPPGSSRSPFRDMSWVWSLEGSIWQSRVLPT